jgi:hypothetical protein
MKKIKTERTEHGKAEIYKCPKCNTERTIYPDFLKHIFSIPEEVKHVQKSRT